MDCGIREGCRGRNGPAAVILGKMKGLRGRSPFDEMLSPDYAATFFFVAVFLAAALMGVRAFFGFFPD